jgi:tetratricopeptide (TPR) repeat protein
MMRTSEAAWVRQDYQQSLEILERAVKLFPADPCVLLDLGRAHGLRHDYTAAEQCFEKAIRVANWKIESFIAAGLHSRNFGHIAMAERYFERALKRNENEVEALVQLAEIHERQHRLDSATILVDRALRANGNASAALLARARLDRQAGRLEEAEKLIRAFVTKPNPDVWTHARGWYELGGILDRQKRYDEAMSAFLEAKALLKSDAPPHWAAQKKAQERLRQTAESISSSDLRRWFESGRELGSVRRHALLGGHPRSGTTLLEQVLDAHPDIVSSEETLIFHDDAYRPLTRGRPPETPVLEILNSATPALLKRSREDYVRITEKFLGAPIRNRLLIDKNPSQTAQVPSVVRIFPETKFLISLRDPRDVCLSCFMQPLALNTVSSAYLTLEGTATEYVSLMGFWRSIMPKLSNPHLEVRYEDLVADLESSARRTLEFLGVPWDARVLEFDEHARNKIVRSPTYADVVKPVFKGAVGRWRNYQKYLEPELPILAPVIKALGYD